jgi:hypothetical protein
LWLAWAILGARRHYQRVLVPLLYQLSVLFLGFGVIGTLVLIAIDLRNPATLEKVRDILLRQDALDKRVRDVSALVDTLVTFPEMLAVVPIYSVMVVAATTWLVFAWGAYGRSLGASRLRSFAACLLTIGIVVVLVSVVAWAASL